MGESTLHYQVQRGLRAFLEAAIENLAVTIDNDTLRNRLESIYEAGTAQMVLVGSLHKGPDFSFAERVPGQLLFPSLVCEIC